MVNRTEESASRCRAALTGHVNTFWMASWTQLSFQSAFVSLASQSISRGIGEHEFKPSYNYNRAPRDRRRTSSDGAKAPRPYSNRNGRALFCQSVGAAVFRKRYESTGWRVSHRCAPNWRRYPLCPYGDAAIVQALIGCTAERCRHLAKEAARDISHMPPTGTAQQTPGSPPPSPGEATCGSTCPIPAATGRILWGRS